MKQQLQRRYSLVIFDWDGTVVNSVPQIVGALKQAAITLKWPVLDDDAYKGVIGLSLTPAVQSLYPHFNECEVSEYIQEYRTCFRVLDQCPPKPFDGAVSGLKILKEKGVVLAVATGKSRAGLQRSMVANEMETMFDLYKTSDDARSKPDPDMLEQIVQELGVPKEQTLMVGDSGFDMEMARSAGIDRAGVSYGAQCVSELEYFQPSYVADSFTDLMSWLELDKLQEVD
ncbi:hypothetical protein ACH42_13395 [Endozoicomonas sp. (ex Bugula neritina AB1)]|nr:hypothetical protein ACH42_13395 [Endozoicomonas sp. (ex Bugula neritina AB1)]